MSESDSKSRAQQAPTLSACGFSEFVNLGSVDEDGFFEVPARHPDLFYMGRFDCAPPEGPIFGYPGVSVRIRFEGEALDVRLLDHGQEGAQTTNFYDVVVDGGPAQLLEVSPKGTAYPLARGLAPGVHLIEVVKRTENSDGSGVGQLLGFRLKAGSKILPVVGRSRRLEFVGDSITCGYGNELAVADPSNFHFTTRNENARLAFGPLTAQALDAEYVLVAASGRGVSRNWQGGPGRHIQAFHELVLPDGENVASWDFARYQPDAVIVNAGTNDFSPGGVDRAAFRAAYVRLLTHLRQVYPRAQLLVLLGPMLSDAFPPGEAALTHIRADLGVVLEERRRGGETQLSLLELSAQASPFGEDWHPSLRTHQQMAAAVTKELTRILGW